MAKKAEEWPLEWTPEGDDPAYREAIAEFEAEVIAYANEHGRAATLAEFPNTDLVEAIFAELDAQSS